MKKKKGAALFKRGFILMIVLLIVLCFTGGDRAVPLVCISVGLCLGILLIVFGIKQFKKIQKADRILDWICNKNVVEYLDNGEISAKVPEEIRGAILHLSQVIGAKYSGELLKKQMEYTVLQNQINPHFLYNTLESIRGQALTSGAVEIADMTEKLSRFFRYCISSHGDIVTIREEINNIQDYFFIQQYRFEDKFALKVDVDDEEALDCYIPKMIFQPIVENAIYHGLEQTKLGGVVKMRIFSTKKKIYIMISDNGIGMEVDLVNRTNDKLRENSMFASSNEKSSGIALVNVNRRIKLHFGEEYGIRITSKLNMGTDVEMIIPHIDDNAQIKTEGW
jgi:sensor histidine kinase YesM